MRRRNIIIIVFAIIIIGFGIFSFTRKPQIKYTTAEVVRGDVLQTVSATGTVEASKKIDLRFVNSGKIEEINVRVGDHAEEGEILAKLDTSQLESQLNKTKANLSAAKANLNKLLEGATSEDIRVSETAVENAQITLNNAKQNLLDVRENASKDIANAQASVGSAEVSLSNAEQSLNNALASNENNLKQDYDSGWDMANSSLTVASNSLNVNEDTLQYSDAQDTLSALNYQYLINSNQSKVVARNSYNAAKSYVESLGSSRSYEEIDQALEKTKKALEDIRTTLNDTNDVLQATVTSSKLSQTELETLKSNISAVRTSTNTAISNVTAAMQNISTQKITNQTSLNDAQASVNSKQSALDAAKQSLLATEAASNAKVNSASNSVKSAEVALKQAQDQLALKKAGPRASEVSLYRAQVEEAQAGVNLIQDQINDSILTAPRDGIITEIKGEEGETVTPAASFIFLITAENFEIKANISEVDIAKVKKDDDVEINFDAIGPDKKFTGTVVEIDPAETEVSGVIYYKVTTVFSGDSQIIKPGMTANLDIMTAKRDDVVLIPFQALKEKNGQKYVQVLEDDVARDIFVEVGLRGDLNIEITNGLREGQKVVTFSEEG